MEHAVCKRLPTHNNSLQSDSTEGDAAKRCRNPILLENTSTQKDTKKLIEWKLQCGNYMLQHGTCKQPIFVELMDWQPLPRGGSRTPKSTAGPPKYCCGWGGVCKLRAPSSSSRHVVNLVCVRFSSFLSFSPWPMAPMAMMMMIGSMFPINLQAHGSWW